MSQFQDFIADSIMYIMDTKKQREVVKHSFINNDGFGRGVPESITDLDDDGIHYFIKDYVLYKADREYYIKQLKEVWDV